jgi:peptidoglycan/xylan/chitin deacetylase (PgdA/CDA1 family)
MVGRILKLAISILIGCIDWFGASLRGLLGFQNKPRCVVIYYHAVRTKFRHNFAWQMGELARLTTPIDLEDVGTLSAGMRYSAVTFDDGFVSVLENALPVLESLGIPCVIFVPTGCLGSHPRWIESAHHDGSETIATSEMIHALSSRPLVRIGSHSVSHPDFRTLEDRLAIEELSSSKDALERITGLRVESFSFPHGAYMQRSLTLAQQCGYARVYTIEPSQLSSVDGFSIGRVRVEPYDWKIEFRLKVRGAYRWMVHASAMKRKLKASLGRGVSELPTGA